MGELGLDIFNVCMNSLLVISIFIVGFSETLSSIVPIFYSQNDFYNVQYIVRKSLLLSLISTIIFTTFILIYPDGILMFFNLAKIPNDTLVENALRIFSISFIPMAVSTTLIFYYEGIERALESGIISFISEMLGPLMFTFALYPIINITSVWLSFPLGVTLSIVVIAIYVKLVERKEKEYSGLFFFKKEIIDKSRNYTITLKNDEVKTDMFNHLKSLNVDATHIETLNQIINIIFESNNENIYIEVLIIDYDDRIVINMKDEGKREVKTDIEKTFTSENVKISEILNFNNIEYEFDKVKD